MGTMFKLSRYVIIGWQYEIPGKSLLIMVHDTPYFSEIKIIEMVFSRRK